MVMIRTLKNYLRYLKFKKDAQPSEYIKSRDENLLAYQRAMLLHSKNCPNLPLNILVEISGRCNLSCRMCNVHFDNKSGLIINDDIIEKTYELARNAINVFTYGLGEPLLHPDIAGVVRRYRSLGVSVSFVTNGMLLNENISTDLIKAGLNYLTVSIDSPDPSLLSIIRKGADLSRILNNIQKLNHLKRVLNSQNPIISMNVVVQKSNFLQIHDIIHLAEKIGIYFINLLPITVHSHISEIQNEGVGPWMEGWKEKLFAWKEVAKLRGIGLETRVLEKVLEGIPPENVYQGVIPCPEPFRFMGIRANGDIFPCCNWDVNEPIARVKDFVSLREAWQCSEWQILREDIISVKYPLQCIKCMKNFTRPFNDEYRPL